MLSFIPALLTLFPLYASADLRTRLNQAGVSAVFQGDPTYEKYATPFNKRLTYMPVAFAFPNSTAQVSAVVKAGVAEGIAVNPKSGGHSYTAFGYGGANGHLVVDLAQVKTIAVDSSTNQASIQAGNRLGDIALALNAQGGRALPHGTCAYVGLGGHAGMGGFGFTSRMWGLTLDNIVGHEVVLANGTIVQTSATQYSDLFWALRGAAPSFGIITTYVFKTYAKPQSVTNWQYQWDLSANDLASAITAWQSFIVNGNVRKEFSGDANLFKGSASGRVKLSLSGGWYGAAGDFQGVIAPLLAKLPAPASQSVKNSDWITGLQALAGNQALSTAGVDLYAEHDTFYTKSLTTPESAPMNSNAIKAFSSYLATTGYSANLAWFVQLEMWGGANSAINAPAVSSTAYSQRDVLFTIQMYASSANYAPPYPTQGFTFLDNMVKSIISNEPSNWPYGAYANYVDDRLADGVWQKLYYGSNYPRLQTLKGAYDPNNVFNFPQAIKKA